MATFGCIQNTKENIQKNGWTVSGVQNKKNNPKTFDKMSSFVFHRRKEVMHVWNDMRMIKLWLHVHFSENYPIKLGSEKALNIPVK